MAYLVVPSSMRFKINNLSYEDRSIFFFDLDEQVNIVCEIYSYPQSTLQLLFNDQITSFNETIDCFNEDLSTIILSNSLCRVQTNWRIRVRISTTLTSTRQHSKGNLTCSVSHFPYGKLWHSSMTIEFQEKQSKNILSTVNYFERSSCHRDSFVHPYHCSSNWRETRLFFFFFSI